MSDLNVVLEDDIYYRNDYSALYTADEGELFSFEYIQGDKKVVFRSIKRPITTVAGLAIDEALCDLETPYGYGGPVTNCFSKAFLSAAFKAYKEECAAQNIVCEFIRFHPFNPLARRAEFFDFHSLERQVVVVDLTLSAQERWAKYSKTTRNILRKANKKLVRSRNGDFLADFCALYQQTMDKNNASEFYYFETDYFKKLASLEGVELLSVNLDSALVSSGFFMHGHELGHYHLSANNGELSRENGNYALLDFAFDYAKSLGCKWMMLGGGRTSDENDSLFRFKVKFSDQYLPFYIAGLTFLPNERSRLNAIWQAENKDDNQKSFQLYRL